MKFLFAVILIAGCSSSSKISIGNSGEKFYLKSGNFSGIDYIMIAKKKHSNKEYVIIIDCNHYISEIGKTLLLKKDVYSSVNKSWYSFHFIKDSFMLLQMNYSYHSNDFKPLANEEYEIIKTAFLKYPELTKKYNLDADKLKNYLGWYEVNPITR